MADSQNSSDFGSDHADFSSSSDEFSDTEEGHGVLPYQYEPVGEEIRDVSLNGSRLTENNDTHSNSESDEWCQCGNCDQMATARECVCCMGIDAVKVKLDSDSVSCIILHPGFEPVCLNLYVLETAYYQYRQQYGNREDHGINERNRYTAYRQLVRWCWGYLGKEVRVVLPACAVLKIRDTFQSDSYVGFQEA